MKKLIIAAVALAAVTVGSAVVAFAASGTKDEMYAYFAYQLMNKQLRGEVKTLTIIKETHSMEMEYFTGEKKTVVVPESL